MRSARHSSRHAAFALLLLLAGPACASRADGPRSGLPSPSTAAQLRRDLDTLLTTGPAARVLWGVRVLPLGADGRAEGVLYERNASQLLMPASNMKILTLAAAAERLGWDYRFETIVRSTTRLEADGTIRGDLVVVGSGDPTIARRNGGRETLASWAERLRELGVRRIEGRVLGDATRFPLSGPAAGWEWDDLPYGYAAPVSALSYNENTVELVIGPGPSVGAAAAVTVAEPAGGIRIRSELRTSGGEARRLRAVWSPRDDTVTLSGEVPLGYEPFRHYVAVPDPPRYFARAFRRALVERGITVIGGAASVETDPPGPDGPGAAVLIRHSSPPLRDIGVTLMKVSQNLYAELLLRTLGLEVRGDPAAGADVVEEVLQAWGAGPDAAIVRDGSGLSRHNLTSARTIGLVLTRMFAPAHRDPWVAAMPIAGVDGTLERRMRESPAEGRVFAKTGSIGYVRALSGYAQTGRGGWVAFSIVANNFAGSVTVADVDLITERVVNRLVELK